MSGPTWVVHPGAGDAVWIGSFGTIYKVPGETTGGSVAVFERYFRELAALMPAAGVPEMQQIVALAGRYGLEFDMEALPALVEAHGLRLG